MSANRNNLELTFKDARSAASGLISKRMLRPLCVNLMIPPAAMKSAVSPTVSTGAFAAAMRISIVFCLAARLM
jgi:hypothetical protein